MTAIEGRSIDFCIEWRTYTPDGRPLVVRRTGDAWAATCADGDEYVDASLHAAIRAAVDHERGPSLALQRRSHDPLGRWIAEQAARIEREARGR